MIRTMKLGGVFGLVMLTACGDAAEGLAPEVGGDALEVQQTVNSTNANGTWSATASFVYSSGYKARTVFTGPTGKTRAMGLCALKLYNETSPVACTTTANCTSAPTSLPTGGARYCIAPENSGQKYCYYRPGGPTTYCAGSPALGGTPVGPGTYTVPTASPSGAWASYGCFEGCVSVVGSSTVMPLSAWTDGYSGNASSFATTIATASAWGGSGGYTYSWSQTSGMAYQIMIASPTSASTTLYRASGGTQPGHYEFTATVTDNQGRTDQAVYYIDLY